MAALLSIPWALSMGSNYPVSVLGVTVVAAFDVARTMLSGLIIAWVYRSSAEVRS